MITVKVEMWPGGDESRAREIGRMYIANVGGDAQRGDYAVAVCRRGTDAIPQPIDPKGPKATRAGQVTRYPRLAYNMWRLITRALRASFPEEDRRAAFPTTFDAEPFEADLEQEIETLRRERDEARADARVLAHAYTTDNRPPTDVVDRATGYPVRP